MLREKRINRKHASCTPISRELGFVDKRWRCVVDNDTTCQLETREKDPQPRGEGGQDVLSLCICRYLDPKDVLQAHNGERDRSEERKRHVEVSRVAADEPVVAVITGMTPLAVFHHLLLLES